jgi:alanine racemase
MNTSEMVSVTNGTLVQGDATKIVGSLLIDSRKFFVAKEVVFIALKGARHDGHAYLDQLYAKGVRNFVYSNDITVADFPDATLVQVEDTLSALQAIAKWHRSQFRIPVVGITGSNGKTVIKEWMAQLIETEYRLVRSPKSYNSQVGVPLSVWQMQPEHTLGIFEAGISQVGEMSKLQSIIQPTIGLITNVYDAHLENFKNREEIVVEKLKLFKTADVIIYSKDHVQITKELDREAYRHLQKRTWSMHQQADLTITTIEKQQEGSTITARYQNAVNTIVIPFTDNASIENAIHCWLLLLELGVEMPSIQKRMQHLLPVAMRLEVKQGINRCILVNDTYSSDLSSLSIALDFLSQQEIGKKKTLILSDIHQSGKPDELLYQEVATMIRSKGVNRLMAIGPRIAQQQAMFTVPTAFFSNTSVFLKQFKAADYKEESILIKGARDFEFERIAERLQEQAHETVLEVNLDALIDNYNYFKSLVHPSTKIMVMVKASSYGAGSFEIASTLQYNRVSYLAVAYADEGILLRERNIHVPIMVLNPEPTAYDAMIRNQLEPEIYNFRTLYRFLEALEGVHHASTEVVPYAVHIKLDTGMHRLGFEEQDLQELAEVLDKQRENIRVVTVFSHLTSSEDAKSDEHSKDQMQCFERMSAVLMSALPYSIDRHLLNTNGILRFPEAQYDMVRLGIGMYGIATPAHQQQLRSVSRLKSTISQIKHIDTGDTVGYGRRFAATTACTIATIPIGYADGLDRKLGRGHWFVRLNGNKVPIIGEICMDMCMLDVTNVNAEEGDTVVVFETAEDLLDMAAELETIPYEIFTNVSARVKRVYYHE